MKPIAIIGLGCRFPGASDPEAFWQLLHNGNDAITEVPSDRWDLEQYYHPEPATPNKMNTRWGGFLNKVADFDGDFFQISPREAERIDPQHRLLLEVAWEALENASLVPSQLSGTPTGVFVGISNSDYNRLTNRDYDNLSVYNSTGTGFSTAANRLSYLLNLKGPSIAIDTACSSSLVALHLACQSLGQQETDVCLVGGVNLILTPEGTIIFSMARMMAADGRCKTFDDRADGYVRGEGCGVVVLKRLEDAIEDNDNIRAIIRGAAVNQDGLTNGITAPNGPSQQAAIRQALKNAGVEPSQIDYIEAHGTGTPLGDPIEFKSLKSVLMEGRSPDRTCWIGSVKTNIGHLESAAGIASLIKVVLALQHQEIPSHLHLQKLNRYISLEDTALDIPTTNQSWKANNRTRLAGISSFGFGGTNCHVILEEAPSPKPITNIQKPLHLLTLSAKTEKALKELAQNYTDYLNSHPDTSLADITFTANRGRTHFPSRLALVTASQAQLQEQLVAFSTGQETPGVYCGRVTRKKPSKIAFLFTGQGSQYLGMGRQLYETQPVFRQSLEDCDEILQPYLDKPLLEILFPTPNSQLLTLLNETAYTQPALFALEYALAQLWQSWGIKPSAVMGHSVGEYVAACLAGVFSLEDGLKLIAHRGRLMQALPQNGAMLAVMADEAKIRSLIANYPEIVSIAAINGLNSIVISGDRETLKALQLSLETEGIKTKLLQVSHAFHSSLMQPMLAEFAKIAQDIDYHQPTLPLISNLTGQVIAADIATPDYWCRHILSPVRFADSMTTLADEGYQVFIEIGPKPVLLGMGRSCITREDGLWLPSLRPEREDWQQMLESLATLSVHGVDIDWAEIETGNRIPLPTYPFQRQRHWFEEKSLPLQNRQQLLAQLQTTGKFSEAELQLIPKLLEVISTPDPSPMEASVTTPGETPKETLADKIGAATTSSEDRQSLLKPYFSQLLAKVTGISTAHLDWQQPLSSLGLDSLMATEMRKRIESDLHINVPVEYFAGLSLEAFCQQMLLLIEGETPQLPLPSESDFGELWFPGLKNRLQAPLRLFGFPYAGGGPSLFQSWSAQLLPDIAFCPVQLPGRENRLSETPFTRLKPLIETLVPLIEPHLTCPFAFFGHSMGALLAFELARELRRRGSPSPRCLFISARPAPQLPDLALPIHNLPDDRFIEAIARFQGTPTAVLQEPTSMQLYLPALRADFALTETYFYSKDQPLDCPIYAVGGLNDSQVSQKDLEAWNRQTSKDFHLTMVSGDHFFLNTAEAQLIHLIGDRLKHLLNFV